MRRLIVLLLLGTIAAVAGVTVKQGEMFYVNTEFTQPATENIGSIQWLQSWDSSLFNLTGITTAENIYASWVEFEDENTKGLSVRWVNAKDIKDGGFYTLGFKALQSGTYEVPEPKNVVIKDPNGLDLPVETSLDLGVEVEPRATTGLTFRTSDTPVTDLVDNNVVKE